MKLYRDNSTKVIGLVVKSKTDYYAMYTIEKWKLRKIRFKVAFISKWLTPIF